VFILVGEGHEVGRKWGESGLNEFFRDHESRTM